MWPKITCARVDAAAARTTSPIARRPARRSSAPDRSACSGPSPSALSAGDGEREARRRARAPRQASRAPSPATVARQARAEALGRRRGRARRRRARRSRRAARTAARARPRSRRASAPSAGERRAARASTPGAEALERRHRHVAVEVVAVGRVDVVAQPDARVGDVERGRLRACRPMRRACRSTPAGPARSSSPSGSAAVARAPVEPRRDRAGGRGCRARARPRRRARAPRRRPRARAARASSASRIGPWRSSSMSPRMTSRSTPSSALEQRAAGGGPAQDVDVAAGPEVQVGDDEGAHGACRLLCPAVAAPALDGILVADFSRVLAGPLCTMSSATSAPTWSRSSAPTAATTRAPGGRRSSTRARPTTSGSTATSARSRSTSRTRPTSRSRASCARAPTSWSSPSGRARCDRLGLGYDEVARGQPGRRLLLDQRVRLGRARPRRCPATTSCCRRWAGSCRSPASPTGGR